MLGGLITMAGGTIAASGFIVSRVPNARHLIDKISTYTGWIGLTMFCWGVWEIIGCVTHMEHLSAYPANWTFWLLSGVADFTVGLLLGFGLISKYVFRGNQMAVEKGQMVREKLVKYQAPLGLFAIVMGALYIVL
jgi:hypothetical protein